MRSTKWDGSLHRQYMAQDLGVDAHGRWLWLPEGTRVRTARATFNAGAAVQLFPSGTWWSAWFAPDWPEVGRPEQLYLDVTTPVVSSVELVEFVDLDLDVVRLGAGDVRLLDEPEFGANRRRFGYPTAVLDRARATADAVLTAVRGADPPFGGEHRPWLAAAPRPPVE